MAAGSRPPCSLVLIPCPIIQLHHVFASGNLKVHFTSLHDLRPDHAEMCQHEMIILLSIEMCHIQFGLLLLTQ